MHYVKVVLSAKTLSDNAQPPHMRMYLVTGPSYRWLSNVFLNKAELQIGSL